MFLDETYFMEGIVLNAKNNINNNYIQTYYE